MSKPGIDYRMLMDRAFRRVIADALAHVADHGLPGDHHFFITYRTGQEGVEMPDWLRAEHPDTLSIILQHEFGDLAADDDGFQVRLSFQDRPALLRVPYDAIEIFADPAVQFGLRFGAEGDARAAPPEASAERPAPRDPSPEEATGEQDNVVRLDAFRS